jgi:hypothetical protein
MYCVETESGKMAYIRFMPATQVARVARMFRLLRLLRLSALYRRFDVRRRIRTALQKAGIQPGNGEPALAAEELNLLELEILGDQDKQTRVGQRLEGKRGLQG